MGPLARREYVSHRQGRYGQASGRPGKSRLRETLNPFELSAAINKKLASIWALASKANLRSAEKPRVRKEPYWQKAREYELPTHLFLPLRNIEMSRMRAQWATESRLRAN